MGELNIEVRLAELVTVAESVLPEQYRVTVRDESSKGEALVDELGGVSFARHSSQNQQSTIDGWRELTVGAYG
jgi:hypothetical protein